ncbi:hypothetical protein QTI66_30735 [Variovorax sp. J22R133]|uniref:hypothetical protein n=1 Tax=Variovorax brevis TaxID=3053503 RepID=UPI00257560A9|nr:hypothetical protein [Variovorax sp. J22R133]MDM0116526.1 hypothetical protein [Variovorax sp. J22R133]
MKRPASLRAVFLPAALLLFAILAVPAQAQVERLDDSTSPRAQVQATLDDGGIARPGTPVSPIARASFGRIDYRLNTARHVGRRARIFYVIPAGVPGVRTPNAVLVQWRSQGLFASGQGRPGERIQVWNGVVRDPWMSEGFELSWQVDLRELRLTRGMRLGFEAYFEIETLP